MKKKFICEWWDDRSDTCQSKGFDNYPEALEFQFTKGKKINRHVRLKLRGEK